MLSICCSYQQIVSKGAHKNCGSVYLANQVETFILLRLRTFLFQISSVMDLLDMSREGLDSCLEMIHDNFAAFGLICGWTLYDILDRKRYLNDLFELHVVPEIIPSDAIEGTFASSNFEQFNQIIIHFCPSNTSHNFFLKLPFLFSFLLDFLKDKQDEKWL